VEGLEQRVASLSCDGSVLVTAEPGGAWRHVLGSTPERLPFEGGLQAPLSMTPDGSVVVANASNYADPGPHPTRWTAGTGAQAVESIDNTLVYQVAPDGVTLLGLDALQIFRFRLGGEKERVQAVYPNTGTTPPDIFVSTNAQTYAFNWTDERDTVFVSRYGYEISCPSVYCTPVAISSTGKVVLVTGPIAPEIGAPWASFVWTEAHGYRRLDELLAEYGAPTSGEVIAADMSDDGQAIIGYIQDDPNGPHPKFHAVLPPAAYD